MRGEEARERIRRIFENGPRLAGFYFFAINNPHLSFWNAVQIYSANPNVTVCIIEQFVEKIVPRNTLEFDWYLNLIPHIFEEHSSTGYNEVWTFVINFDEAEKYRKLRGGFLRKNQWRDLTVHVFV